MIKIAMFSGPRNISTTMMRSFENRPDTAVFDEPFYACHLAETGAPHPMREEILAAQPNNWATVIDQLNASPTNGAAISFQKHIAFHFSGDGPLDWVHDTRVIMLIRDPRAMVASYKNKYDDVAPIIDSFRIQREIHQECIKRAAPCPIIDARDVLLNPPGMMRALCDELDITFSETMLSWPEGPRDSDGVWAPHWYDAVWASTEFKPYEEKEIALTPELEKVANDCQADYQYLYERRLTLPQ